MTICTRMNLIRWVGYHSYINTFLSFEVCSCTFIFSILWVSCFEFPDIYFCHLYVLLCYHLHLLFFTPHCLLSQVPLVWKLHEIIVRVKMIKGMSCSKGVGNEDYVLNTSSICTIISQGDRLSHRKISIVINLSLLYSRA